MDLLLWRHAEAEDARAGQDDLARELTPRGQEQAARMAAWLAGVLPGDARVIASPARRTLQTVQPLGRAFEVVDAVAPGAGPRDLVEAVGWPRAGDTVLVVGHQPTMGAVASMLMSGRPLPWHFAKAGIWWLRSDGDRLATLVAMRSPRYP